MIKLNKKELTLYFTFIMYVFFSCLSGKSAKFIFPYNGPWINPQFFFGILIIGLLYKEIKSNLVLSKNVKYALGFVAIYMISFIVAFIMNQHFYKSGIVEVAKVFGNVILIYLVVSNINKDTMKILLNSIVIVCITLVLLEILGILAYKGYIPLPDNLMYYVDLSIGPQQWIFIGEHTFIVPKFGVTYMETQNLSLILFIGYISILMLKIYYNEFSKFNKVSIWILSIAIVYNLSKAILACFMLFNVTLLFFKYIKPKIKDTKKFYIILVSVGVVLIGLVLVIFTSKELMNLKDSGMSLIEYGKTSQSSIAQRVFLIAMGVTLLVSNLKNILIGLGPKQYGINLSHMKGLEGLYGVESSAISIFQVVIDVGLIGTVIFILFLKSIYTIIKNDVFKVIGLTCIMIGTSPLPDYLPSIIWLMLGVIANNNIINKETTNLI